MGRLVSRGRRIWAMMRSYRRSLSSRYRLWLVEIDLHVMSGNVWGVCSDMQAPVPFWGNSGVYMGALIQLLLGRDILYSRNASSQRFEMATMRVGVGMKGALPTIIYYYCCQVPRRLGVWICLSFLSWPWRCMP